MILLNRPQQGGDWVCAWPLGRCVKSAEGSYRRGRFRQRSLLPARAENIGRNDRDFLRKEAYAEPEDGDRGDKVQRAVMPVIPLSKRWRGICRVLEAGDTCTMKCLNPKKMPKVAP